MIEQVTTAIFVSKNFNCVIDKYGSFILYHKDHPDLVGDAQLKQGQENIRHE